MFMKDCGLKMVYMMRVVAIQLLLAVTFSWVNGFTALRSQLRGIFYDVAMQGISLSMFRNDAINQPHRSEMIFLSHP